jgi:hypothetical protein
MNDLGALLADFSEYLHLTFVKRQASCTCGWVDSVLTPQSSPAAMPAGTQLWLCGTLD